MGAAGDLAQLLQTCTLVVPAFGYAAASFPIHDEDGSPIALAGEYGGRFVDDSCRVARLDGTPLERVFAIGMASGFLPSGPELGGEPSFVGETNGVWLYQNGIGRRVLDGLARVTAPA